MRTHRITPHVERIHPTHMPWGYRGIVRQHLSRYEFAQELGAVGTVLDVACGTGYGSRMLADTARTVVGIDNAGPAIEIARREFSARNVIFLRGDVAALPLSRASVDLAVSFETIEHLPPQRIEPFLSELARVVRPGGLVCLSTPDRDVFSLGGPASNPFHSWEFSRSGFRERVSAHFIIERELGQTLVPVRLIRLVKRWARGPHHPWAQRLWRAAVSVAPGTERIREYDICGSELPFYVVLLARRV